jgi:rare lipoprotein A
MLLALALGGCAAAIKREPPSKAPAAPRPGGYYLDDGPGGPPPVDLDTVPEPVPRLEPLHRGASRPYVVMGRQYTPMTRLEPYRARGIATWYGRRYHGRQTSSGEIYDMYAITAAHPTLPIPSYARVTNLQNGKTIVVRINDRGPFVEGRLIDLSYTAAHRLGILAAGSAMVEVEAIVPDAPAPQLAAAAAVPSPDAGMRSAPAVPAVESAKPAPEPARVPIASEGGRHYLQLGAFGSRENAESFLARLRAQLDWLGDTLHLFAAADGLYRVHAGPYASAPEARQAAERLLRSLGVKPFVLTR